MPHAVIQDPPDLRELHRQFVPWAETQDDGTKIQARGAYLRHDGNTILVETMVLELGPAVEFFIAVEHKKSQVTVRCHPFPSPARTRGIQTAVAKVVRDVLAAGGTIERTNLEL